MNQPGRPEDVMYAEYGACPSCGSGLYLDGSCPYCHDPDAPWNYEDDCCFEYDYEEDYCCWHPKYEGPKGYCACREHHKYQRRINSMWYRLFANIRRWAGNTFRKIKGLPDGFKPDPIPDDELPF